jgi:broad specificity phosphatase PhoE
VILLVRHGESTWNAEHRWAGQADPPLTDAGRAGARRLGERLAGCGIAAVASSDLRRAAQTAEIVAAELAIEGVHVDTRLRERRCDAWSGRSSTEIERTHPGLLARWRRGELRDLPSPSEPWPEFRHRVLTSLTALASTGERWLVVAHAGLFRVVEADCGAEFGHRRVANLDGLWLRQVGGRLVAGEAAP